MISISVKNPSSSISGETIKIERVASDKQKLKCITMPKGTASKFLTTLKLSWEY